MAIKLLDYTKYTTASRFEGMTSDEIMNLLTPAARMEIIAYHYFNELARELKPKGMFTKKK